MQQHEERIIHLCGCAPTLCPSQKQNAGLHTSEKLLGNVQRVPKAKVLPTEQGQDDLILLLNIVFRKMRQKLLEVFTLRVTQHFLPCGEADHIKEYLRLEDIRKSRRK